MIRQTRRLYAFISWHDGTCTASTIARGRKHMCKPSNQRRKLCIPQNCEPADCFCCCYYYTGFGGTGHCPGSSIRRRTSRTKRYDLTWFVPVKKSPEKHSFQQDFFRFISDRWKTLEVYKHSLKKYFIDGFASFFITFLCNVVVYEKFPQGVSSQDNMNELLTPAMLTLIIRCIIKRDYRGVFSVTYELGLSRNVQQLANRQPALRVDLDCCYKSRQGLLQITMAI